MHCAKNFAIQMGNFLASSVPRPYFAASDFYIFLYLKKWFDFDGGEREVVESCGAELPDSKFYMQRI